MVDRRARRRQETIEEILNLAVDVMTEVGVNGLSLAEVARRLGVQPPSLYKYFPSLMAIYDALFERGQRELGAVIEHAMETAEPGLPAIDAGLEASLRWSLEHRAVAQLMFWRPVPSFEPSEAAFAPSVAWVNLLRAALAEGVARGHLGAGADSEEGLALLAILSSGIFSQAVANEPDARAGSGRFASMWPVLIQLFANAYPPN